jgi:hypothetical protein
MMMMTSAPRVKVGLNLYALNGDCHLH